MRLFNPHLILFTLSILFSPHTIYADRMSVVFDNDALFPGNENDGSYTNGLQIGWLGDELHSDDQNESEPQYGIFMQSAVNAIPFISLDEQKNHSAGISVRQMIFTPSDVSKSQVNYNDTPYAGALLTSLFLFEWDSYNYDEFSIKLGVVGPASGAEQMQKLGHKVGPFNDPKGWDHQLDNQLMFGIAYEYGEKTWTTHYDNGLASDWVNTLRFEVGNFITGFSCNTIWRIGENYPNGFKTYYPGMMGNSALLTEAAKSTGWSLSAGLEADAISYFYVIDSADQYNIDRNRFSGSLIGSASLYLDNVEISLSMRYGTSMLKHHSETKLGSIIAIWHF